MVTLLQSVRLRLVQYNCLYSIDYVLVLLYYYAYI